MNRFPVFPLYVLDIILVKTKKKYILVSQHYIHLGLQSAMCIRPHLGDL